jgi:hypothetical protein
MAYYYYCLKIELKKGKGKKWKGWAEEKGKKCTKMVDL